MIMQQDGIRTKTVKRYKRTTNSNHKQKIAENRLKQNFSINIANKIWRSDITYLRTKEGWLYLAAILDLYPRRVVGLNLDKQLSTVLVLRALQRALEERSIEEGMVFHADQGIKYASNQMTNTL